MCSFLFQSEKKGQKKIAFTWNGQQYILMFTPSHIVLMVKKRFFPPFFLFWNNSKLIKNCKTSAKNIFVLSRLRVCRQQEYVTLSITLLCILSTNNNILLPNHLQPSKPGHWQLYFNLIHRSHLSFTNCPYNVLAKESNPGSYLSFSFHPSLVSLVWSISSIIPWPSWPLLMTGQLFSRRPSIWVCLLYPHVQIQVMHFGRKSQKWFCVLPLVTNQVGHNFNLLHYLWC